jgi:Trypsin
MDTFRKSWRPIFFFAVLGWLLVGPLGAQTPSIAGGGDDDGTPETDVVVQLISSNNLVCTGTFLTTMTVLTAAHCLNGTAGELPPMAFPITINVGSVQGSWVRQYTSNNVTPFKSWEAGPQQSSVFGNDLAILFLDPPGTILLGAKPGPAFDYATILHPTLSSPCPMSGCDNDSNGGDYSPPLGMAGWAPRDAGHARQVAFDTSFNHYPGSPDGVGQYWQHDQGSIHDDPGDSGGPLFVRRPVANQPGLFCRDVIGVCTESTRLCVWGHATTTFGQTSPAARCRIGSEARWRIRLPEARDGGPSTPGSYGRGM